MSLFNTNDFGPNTGDEYARKVYKDLYRPEALDSKKITDVGVLDDHITRFRNGKEKRELPYTKDITKVFLVSGSVELGSSCKFNITTVNEYFLKAFYNITLGEVEVIRSVTTVTDSQFLVLLRASLKKSLEKDVAGLPLKLTTAQTTAVAAALADPKLKAYTYTSASSNKKMTFDECLTAYNAGELHDLIKHCPNLAYHLVHEYVERHEGAHVSTITGDGLYAFAKAYGRLGDEDALNKAAGAED